MPQIPSDRINSGSWILEQLTLQLPDVEMAAGRRAWHEAQAAWPGQERRLWWKWSAEAAESIGLATKTVDCSVKEAIDLIHNGAQLICWREINSNEQMHGEWIGIRESRRNRFEVNQADMVTKTAVVKQRSL